MSGIALISGLTGAEIARIALCTDARLQMDTNGLQPEDLGTCGRFQVCMHKEVDDSGGLYTLTLTLTLTLILILIGPYRWYKIPRVFLLRRLRAIEALHLTHSWWGGRGTFESQV